MRILGIDPGLARVGFGLLDLDEQTDRFGPSHWGVISTSKDKPDGARLQEIRDDLTAVIQRLEPQVVALERLFYFRNATTLVPVAQSRGIILMILHEAGLPVHEYTPMQVKQSITGYGKSQKADIQELLVTLLDLPQKPTPDDAADGLALAYTYYLHEARLSVSLS